MVICRIAKNSKENKEKIKLKSKLYYEKNRIDRINYSKNYFIKRRQIDQKFRILDNLRRRVNLYLKKENKEFTTIELLGCSIQKLKQHLELQFKPGMSWNNYGLYGWHIDHIKPCVLFDLTNPEEQKKCFHYTNLQPLWREENLSKGKKWSEII